MSTETTAKRRGCVRGAATIALQVALSCMVAAAGHAADGETSLPWLDNEYYKLLLDVRARVEVAKIDKLDRSEAYTIRTRAGLMAKPYYGFSGLAELENTYSLADSQYFDGAEGPTGQTVIPDPENIELNRGWVMYDARDLLGGGFGLSAKAGIQRIKLDDDRFVGNVGWRQNEQTYHAAMGQSDFGLKGLTTQYIYIWNVQRIFGDEGSANDWDSDSHLARVNYAFDDRTNLSVFAYHLDFDMDSPANSTNSYGFRFQTKLDLADGFALGGAASYAVQTDTANNPVDYVAHYAWINLDLFVKCLGKIGAGYEMLGSDDGNAQFRTPLATAHKFNGFADAFLDNGGALGLHDFFVTLGPKLPFAFKGKLIYHAFWYVDTGSAAGNEIDAVLSHALGKHFTALAKFAYFNENQGAAPASTPRATRWRQIFQLTYHY